MRLNIGRSFTVFLLLTGSWAIELGLGILLVNWYWGEPWLLRYPSRNLDEAVTHILPWLTPNTLLRFWIGSFIVLHLIYSLWTVFLQPCIQRWSLGARTPSRREQELFERAYITLSRNSTRRIQRPRIWKTVDGPGLQMRWIGYVLLIDREILSHRYFLPLLAHELGYCNSEYRVVQRLYSMLPPTHLAPTLLGGFPLALGTLISYPFWMWYWRRHVYRADAFAVELGQGYQLLQALEEIYLPLDLTTRGGRWLKFLPYIEQRRDHLARLLF